MAGAFPQPISTQDLLAAVDLAGMARGGEESEEFVAHLRALDAAWMADQHAKQKKRT